ncbi:MAG TPA: starvation-sensing protein RspA, partial [Thermomicrobiales bacterium]|nr:starvation-sensing protein RspA [Thermomicrobiales bacterium]
MSDQSPTWPLAPQPWPASTNCTTVTVRDVRVICTQPEGIRLIVVKIETSEPGLYGLGCATFCQRATAVVDAVENYLKPMIMGRDVADIEDIYQTGYLSSYWRTGPIMNNALSGVDQALWDLKGKMANMPVYQLLGGKTRRAATVYTHASGDTIEETV